MSEDERERADFAVGLGSDILVVDDNEGNLIAIEAALQPLGRKLVFARSGAEALARLLDQDFALILLDVAMPTMDGFETAQLVRARERNRATPIIFISGRQWQDEQVVRSYELGAFDFLLKPIREEILRAKARVFVELQERTLQLRAAEVRAHERELAAQRRKFEAEAMERQMRQLAEADRRKDEFLAILAHELRTPLQPLQTSLELLARSAGQPVPPDVLDIMRRRYKQVSRLVDDLLDVARYTSNRLELHRQLLHISRVVEDSIESSRTAIDARQHSVVVHGEDAVVDADPVRLVQVICNLLTNAARYTAPCGTIEVRYGCEGDEVFIRVTDNGRGITPQLLTSIFEMFVRERVASDGSEGLGLGLGLAKRLIDLHGGTITAASPGPGKGSTFEVRLPKTVGGSAPGPSVVSSVERSLHIVVCEDADDVRELVSELLRSHGHRVTAVATGEDAVRAITGERPDAAVIDIGLPGITGHEVARTLRRDLGDSCPRLIAMTGFGQLHDRAAALAAGFDIHIAKPASSENILGALTGL